MTLLYNGDCNDLMSEVADDSVDLIFTDLPYGQVSCDWDKKIDLTKMWDHFMRVKKEKAPIFFCCSTKFGAELIASAPKKCPFRYDIVWVKSAPCGFLSARKMPMRKHEMLYVFYEKLPFYDLSSHSHKFIKESKGRFGNCYNREGKVDVAPTLKYDPPLPVSVQKEDCYQSNKTDDSLRAGHRDKSYDPPLPTSVQKEAQFEGIYNGGEPLKQMRQGQGGGHYDPPLPVSVQKEESNMVVPESDIYGGAPREQSRKAGGCQVRYDPPLPVSVQKEGQNGTIDGNEVYKGDKVLYRSESGLWDPPLPNSILEVKSEKGKHATQKPTGLMKWVLKYYSKEGDVILDPTMGSGSTGVACMEMKRNFIGIEMNPEIFEVAEARLS